MIKRKEVSLDTTNKDSLSKNNAFEFTLRFDYSLEYILIIIFRKKKVNNK